MASCSGSGEHKTTEAETTATTVAAAEKATWTVDPSASRVRWEGGTSGAMVYSHFGSIKVKEGALSTEGNSITGGDIVIDMTTISPEDNGYSAENPKEKLVGHLSTGDFFLVEEFPTATFKVKSVEGSQMKGDLTIRDKTHEETVNLNTVEVSPDGSLIKASGTLAFDRQKYDVKWAHFMKDVILADEIKLDVTLVAKKG